MDQPTFHRHHHPQLPRLLLHLPLHLLQHRVQVRRPPHLHLPHLALVQHVAVEHRPAVMCATIHRPMTAAPVTSLLPRALVRLQLHLLHHLHHRLRPIRLVKRCLVPPAPVAAVEHVTVHRPSLASQVVCAQGVLRGVETHATIQMSTVVIAPIS